MNFTDLEIDKISNAPLKFQVDFRDSQLKIQNFESPRASFSKKEKRNRKFFLKRSVFLVQICKQTGNIELKLGSDFLHIEIMQGGHLPLNQYNIKDIRSETFVNDHDFKEQNVENSLKLASNHLRKKIKEIHHIKSSYGHSQYQSKDFQRLNENLKGNLKGNFTNIFDQSDCHQRVTTDKIQAIEEAKKILKAQHQDIKNFLYKK
ncbi:unnamed protein product [Paramecium sonneborni]|uniref:Uncharacterized protein n=1 Tax=Paramecium sonneborni TaxID=65129 RepID=A0A8S1QI10_9CILI|nr:unnamed protein product [Paramecium sonneborni]